MTSSFGTIELTLESVRNSTPDERIHGGGQFDFVVDRHGWASYTKAVAEIRASPGYEQEPVRVFVDCLNALIDHLRDLGHPWMRQLEEHDLFQVTVKVGDNYSAQWGLGRTQGVTPPIIGLTAEATAEVRRRLEQNESLALWRMLQLDAIEALETGNYEEAVLLSWSALESAARTELPRMAKAKGMEPKALWERLLGNSPRAKPLSLEEVIERGRPNIFTLLEACSEMSESGYDPMSLAQSVRAAYERRNLVVHEGLRLSRYDALRVIESVNFILSAWRFSTTRPPNKEFDTSNWLQHCEQISESLVTSFGGTTATLILSNPQEPREPLLYPFDLEVWNDRFRIFLPRDIAESVAACLLLLFNDSFNRPAEDSACLVYRPDAYWFPPGYLNQIVFNVNRSVFLAFYILEREREGLPVVDASNHMISAWHETFSQISHTFEEGDVRFYQVASRFAAFLTRADGIIKADFRSKLTAKHKTLIDKAFEIELILRSTLSLDDPHSLCKAFRQIHAKTMWLDTFTVACPAEGLAFGTRAHPLDDWLTT